MVASAILQWQGFLGSQLEGTRRGVWLAARRPWKAAPGDTKTVIAILKEIMIAIKMLALMIAIGIVINDNRDSKSKSNSHRMEQNSTAPVEFLKMMKGLQKPQGYGG